MLQRKQLALTYLDSAPSQPENAPMLVMLHGYGSNEKDLIQLAPLLGSSLHFISVRAPLTLDFGMFGWFPLEFTANGITGDQEAAEAARAQLTRFITELITSYKPKGNKVFLMGFSQGTVMSYATAFIKPDLLHGVIACSGQLPEQLFPDTAVEPLLKQLPFLVMHGVYDEVLPIEKGRSANTWFREKVLDLTYREYPVAHEISPAALHLTARWLKERIAKLPG